MNQFQSLCRANNYAVTVVRYLGQSCNVICNVWIDRLGRMNDYIERIVGAYVCCKTRS